MMSEREIRDFVRGALLAYLQSVGGSEQGPVSAITARWLADREEAAGEAKDEVYDEQRDSWNGD